MNLPYLSSPEERQNLHQLDIIRNSMWTACGVMLLYSYQAN